MTNTIGVISIIQSIRVWLINVDAKTSDYISTVSNIPKFQRLHNGSPMNDAQFSSI